MLAKVTSFALIGLESTPVQVEIDISRGLPSQTIVGLPDAAVRESSERVRAAIVNSGLIHPRARLTVNLAPADLRKEGPAYDLPIAVGILLATEQVSADLAEAGLIGELSLDGEVRGITGVLPMAVAAREHGVTTLYVPQTNAAEAALVEGLTVIPVASLASLVGHLHGYAPIPIYDSKRPFDDTPAGLSRRFLRRQGAGACQAGARSGRSRDAQHDDDRPARGGQDAPGAGGAVDPAADDVRGSADHDQDL